MPGDDTKGPAAIYASAGRHLICFRLDAAKGALIERSVVTLPQNVQYAVPHPSRPVLYVAASNGTDGDNHSITAFAIASSGQLSPLGAAVTLPHRPIHFTVDPAGAFVLLACNKPRAVSVYRLDGAGPIGAAVPQDPPAEVGFFLHQVRVHPASGTVIAPALGWRKTATAAEQQGRIVTFAFADGRLTRTGTVEFGPGLGPRHVDFHPTGKLVYVAVERGNRLNAYALEGTRLAATPLYSVPTLCDAANDGPEQRAGAIHLHPNGRFLYVTNRNDAPAADGTLAGGENTIAAFALDPGTGAPTLIQHEDTRGVEPRTFAITPCGDAIIVANQESMAFAGGTQARPNLALFSVAADGRVKFAGAADLPREGDAMWVGAVALPNR